MKCSFEKIVKSLLILFYLLPTLAGCKRSISQAPPEREKQILHLNLHPEPSSLDPRREFEPKAQIIVKALFEGLTRVGLDGQIHPAAAESIDCSDDGKVYTFILRECCWSNGETIQASDFAYTWKSILASDAICPLADLFYSIKNAKQAKQNSVSLDEVGIHVIDERTLQVELEHPTPYFLYLVSNPIFSPISQKTVLKDVHWSKKIGDDYICNGPFRLKEYEPEKHLVLEKNPLYHDQEAVQLNEVHISFVKDPYTAFLMFEKGEIDWMGEPITKIPLDALPALLETDQLLVTPGASVFWLECNTNRFPLNSSNIRKALAYAIDRQEIVDHVLIGHKVALSIVPEMMRVLNEEELFIGNNFALARDFFEQGLNELGITREDFPPIVLSYTPVAGYKPVAETLQQQWKQELGIDVVLECFDWPTYLSRFTNHQFQIAPIGWTSFFRDPIYNLQVFRYRSNTNNWADWEEASYQRLLDDADSEVNLEKRKEFLRLAEKILLDEMPVIPLTYQFYRGIKNECVENMLITELGEVDIKWVKIVRAKKAAGAS